MPAVPPAFSLSLEQSLGNGGLTETGAGKKNWALQTWPMVSGFGYNLGQCEAGDLRHCKGDVPAFDFSQSFLPTIRKNISAFSFAGKAAVLVAAAALQLQQQHVPVTALRSQVHILRDELKGGGSYSAGYINLVLPICFAETIL